MATPELNLGMSQTDINAGGYLTTLPVPWFSSTGVLKGHGRMVCAYREPLVMILPKRFWDRVPYANAPKTPPRVPGDFAS
jgi:hypothetical protein